MSVIVKPEHYSAHHQCSKVSDGVWPKSSNLSCRKTRGGKVRPNGRRITELNRAEPFHSHGGTRLGADVVYLIYSADPQSHMTPVSDTSLGGHMSRGAPGSSLMDTFLGLDTLVEKRASGRMH